MTVRLPHRVASRAQPLIPQPQTMDYLTIIATRSLILFPQSPSKPAHHRTYSSSSSGSSSSPRTPTTSLPGPAPINMAIHNFMTSDADCAYFLVTHVLTHPSLYPSSIALGGVSKEVAAEAETMVWLEIDKATVFIRRLGEWFATHAEGITEGVLEKLAHSVGLGWKEVAGSIVEGVGEVDSLHEDVISEKYTHSVHLEEVDETAVLA